MRRRGVAASAPQAGLALALGLLAPLVGCSRASELTLRIRLPADKTGLQQVTQVNLSATRSGVVLAQRSFAASAGEVSLPSLSYGDDTVLTLDGVDASGHVIARGQTCPTSFAGAGTTAALYFAPTSSFSPTANAPLTARRAGAALALSDGGVLLAGGADANGAPLGSLELFTPGDDTFAASPLTLGTPRWRAQSVAIPSVGGLMVGGLDADGVALAGAELYRSTSLAVLPLSGNSLDARVGHRVVVLKDGRALVIGGAASPGGAPLGTTVLVHVLSTGDYQLASGPTLLQPRREAAAVVAAGDVPLVFGGYDAAGAPLASIEALDVAAGTSTQVASLATPRAEATASLLQDGSVLVVGGVDGSGAPLATAELLTPYAQKTTVYALSAARRGHTATVLADGFVLVAGGLDASGAPIDRVELFVLDSSGAPSDFVNERPLSVARGGHDAVPLCNGNVLLIGGQADGAPGAELYTE